MQRDLETPLRLAVWSGPRNISTALMRAWSQRADCAVVDEPLYAHYLAVTGMDHPARDDIVAAGQTDPARLQAWLAGPVPAGRRVWYQKHMAQHLVPGVDGRWVLALHNVFLIRDPALAVASYVKSRADVAPADIGLLQQAELFDRVADHLGRAPLVIDGESFLRDPRLQLAAMCADAGLAFDEAMLHWPAGRHPGDGVWAPHWYAAVWRSTGFEPWQPRQAVLEAHGERVAAACRPAYDKLLAFAAAAPD